MLFIKPKREVHTVFLHYSASDNPDHDNRATIESWHKERGFDEIGYHYYIRKSGLIETGRDLEKIPAAQLDYNTGSIAICCGGKTNFTVAQMQSLQRLCGKINESYPEPLRFKGHCEVARTPCPEFDYKEILSVSIDGWLMTDERFDILKLL